MEHEEQIEKKEINEQELQKEYLSSFRPVNEGQMLDGKVVAINEDNVFVDIGYKSEGKLNISEFEEKPKIGDTVTVVLVRKESKDGNVILSKKQADERLFWKNIRAAATNKEPVKGRIARKIKGGFEVDLGKGILGFVPLSKIDSGRINDPDEYVGLESYFYIEKLYNKGKVNIVANRKEWVESERERRRKEFFENTKIGDVIEGKVKSFTSFGAFIDLGGFDGLLHINDMSWGHVTSPKEVVKIGDTIRVKVIRLDEKENRINLSIKHFTEDPWMHFEEKYHVGDVVQGKVTKLADFGAFIEIEEGIEGLVHISEFSWVRRIRHPKEVLKKGDSVEVKILAYDVQQGKLSLGLKQVYPNPWDNIDERFPIGMRIKRKVKNITNFGAFLEVEEGIDGLLHVDDMSWTKKINDPSEILSVGQEIEVMVIDIDKENQKIKLGLKQLSEDPWKSLGKAFHRGSVIEGTIKEINESGMILEVQGGINGRVNRSNMFDPELETIEDVLSKFKEGDRVSTVITEINPRRQRLFLSLREYYRKQQHEEMVKYLHNEDAGEKIALSEFIKEKEKD